MKSQTTNVIQGENIMQLLIENYLEKHFVPLAAKLDSNRYITALKDSFFGAMPLLIVGSFFLLLSNIPISGYSEFMISILGESWADIFTIPYDATMNIMTLYIIITMAISLANNYKIDQIASIIASLTGFLVITPFSELADGTSGIPADNLSASGLFLGMIVTALSVEIVNFCYKKDIRLKMPESVPPNVTKSFSSLIPIAIVIIVFNIIRILFTLTNTGTAHAFIFQNLQGPLVRFGTTLPATLFVIFFKGFLWVLGIHGANIVGGIMNPIWLSNTADNASAMAKGTIPPHIVTSQFDGNFVQLGGSGATIGLLILILFFAKSTQFKQVGKLSVWSGIFNINEPLIFGIPLVLNPIMILPFLVTPIILALMAYFAMDWGLVPLTNGTNIPWTTPPIISGFLVSGWKGALLNVFQIIVSLLCYYPFFKVADGIAYKKEIEAASETVNDTLKIEKKEQDELSIEL